MTPLSLIFRQHPQYAAMTEVDEYNHVLLPWVHGRLVQYRGPNGLICATWTRPTRGRSVDTLMAGKADEALWRDHTDDISYTPWLVDVAGGDGVSARDIGTFVMNMVIERGIASYGQKVLFHRNSGIRPGRIGSYTARRR